MIPQWLSRYGSFKIKKSLVQKEVTDETSVEVAADSEDGMEDGTSEKVHTVKKRVRRTRKKVSEDFEDSETEISEEDAEILQLTPSSSKTRKRSNVITDIDTDESEYVTLAEVLPQVPTRGPFKVSDVRRSVYFFS